MIKSFLILISFSILLFSSQQIVLVVADDFETNRANLEFYEDESKLFSTQVNIGTNGLAWGIGEISFDQNPNDPIKREGDKKAPAGVFRLTDIFGYAKSSSYKLPYLYASKNLICVDDTDSNFYNHIIIKNGDEKSFEDMRREDHQYELGVVVAQNQRGVKMRGSCVFLHVYRDKNSSTAGCSAMSLEELKEIASLLDKSKNPLLVQIPKSSSKEVLKHFPQLKGSTLLHHP